MGTFQEAQKSTGGTYRNAQAAPRKRSTGGDVIRSTGAGLLRGISGAIASNPIPQILDPLGVRHAAREGLIAAADTLAPPVVGGLIRSVDPTTVPQSLDYQPQTRAGRYAKTVAEFAPAALTPSKGGLIRQVAGRTAGVVVPGIASEGAGEIAEAAGLGEGGQAAARFVGGLVGGFTTALRPPKPGAKKVPVPSVDEMRAAKTAAYKAVDDVGAAYSPEFVTKLADDITADLTAAKISPSRHPKASSMLEDIQKLKNTPQTLTELDQLRQVIRRDVASALDDGEKLMGSKMIERLDQVIDAADDTAMIAGKAEGAAKAITEARAANTRFKKVEAVTDAVADAADKAGSTYSGGNIDNATRQSLRQVLKRTKNLTPDETKALRGIVRGTLGHNTLRLVGRFSPQNPIAGTFGAVAGSVGGGPLGAAAVPAAGFVAKATAERITRAKVDNLIRLMAKGGKKGLDAEQEIAALAEQSPEVAEVYSKTVEYLLRAGVTGTLAANAGSVE